jgi:hypothetical protein
MPGDPTIFLDTSPEASEYDSDHYEEGVNASATTNKL